MYDTLTASDTYRTRMSSFEALRELRRVAGTQLDARYVEVLAGLLSGEGVEYRHADAADFDTELDMERRIKEAGTGWAGQLARPRPGAQLPLPLSGSRARRRRPVAANVLSSAVLAAALRWSRAALQLARNCSICSALKRR